MFYDINKFHYSFFYFLFDAGKIDFKMFGSLMVKRVGGKCE